MNTKTKGKKIAPTRGVYRSHSYKSAGEPSMEEILASIRRIIAADEFRDKKLSESKEKVVLSLSGIVSAKKKTAQGILIKSTSLVWNEVARSLGNDWSRAFEIPPEKWEEIVAGAFDKAGFDQVTLTPRSGDHGRDVIAVRNGVGSIKIIGSVKAYKPGHLVKHDDVRALLGVLNGEQNASKGIITTTSDFAPRIKTDPFIKPFLPTRLELMNGDQLMRWLQGLAKR
jgi:restriction system protein